MMIASIKNLLETSTIEVNGKPKAIILRTDPLYTYLSTSEEFKSLIEKDSVLIGEAMIDLSKTNEVCAAIEKLSIINKRGDDDVIINSSSSLPPPPPLRKRPSEWSEEDLKALEKSDKAIQKQKSIAALIKHIQEKITELQELLMVAEE